MRPWAEIGDGQTVLDAPCGGGAAFRSLPADRDVRYLAIDIDETMLAAGGRLIGTTFLAGGTRRAKALFGVGARRGRPLPPALEGG
jgi:SAM-dependent methyltransferase